MLLTAQQILANGGVPVSTAMLDQRNTKVWGKQCAGCGSVRAYSHFKRDSSFRSGRYPLCWDCATSPKLSVVEHMYRLKEANYFSQAVRDQRWASQTDYENEEARLSGKWLHHSELIRRLRQLNPNLYFMDGNIVDNIAVYRVWGRPQANGNDFKYLWYIPMGMMPEFSTYQLNERDILIREKKRGWRTPLLRCVITGLFTEEACEKTFGRPSGIASTVWKRTLYNWRNGRA